MEVELGQKQTRTLSVLAFSGPWHQLEILSHLWELQSKPIFKLNKKEKKKRTREKNVQTPFQTRHVEEKATFAQAKKALLKKVDFFKSRFCN